MSLRSVSIVALAVTSFTLGAVADNAAFPDKIQKRSPQDLIDEPPLAFPTAALSAVPSALPSAFPSDLPALNAFHGSKLHDISDSGEGYELPEFGDLDKRSPQDLTAEPSAVPIVGGSKLHSIGTSSEGETIPEFDDADLSKRLIVEDVADVDGDLGNETIPVDRRSPQFSDSAPEGSIAETGLLGEEEGEYSLYGRAPQDPIDDDPIDDEPITSISTSGGDYGNPGFTAWPRSAQSELAELGGTNSILRVSGSMEGEDSLEYTTFDHRSVGSPAARAVAAVRAALSLE